MIQRELTDAGGGADELAGVAAVVASHQNNPTGRVPGGVSQSGLVQCDVVLLPAPAALWELQAVSGGAWIDSATDKVPGQSVPHSGTGGDVGEWERPLGGRYEELSLVVRGDQNTWKSHPSN